MKRRRGPTTWPDPGELVHVRIELAEDVPWNAARAATAFRRLAWIDRDFPAAPGLVFWWRRPYRAPRSALARALSQAGCVGRLSVVAGVWPEEPSPRWTAINPAATTWRRAA